MYQRKRLQLLSESRPVPQAQLRIDGSLFRADREGQVEILLEPGVHQVEISAGGPWVRRVIRTTHDGAIIQVELGPSTDHGLQAPAPAAPRPTPAPAAPRSTPAPLAPRLTPPRAQAPAPRPTRTPAVYADRYVYEDVVGRGGMSVVIRARDRVLNRPVAIKLLSEELQDNAEAHEIFMAEAHHLATLAHPNLVSVHDVGVQDQRAFMVQEYVQGEDLEALAHRFQGLPAALAVPIMVQLARGVAYLHTQQIIHRDLKPGNAILQGDGTLKIIDFGLARRLEDLAVRTTRIRGTPAYMAPEQIQGGELTPAADVYQLGATFFELLSGRLPFEEGDISYAHIHRPAPSIHEFVKGVPAELAALIAQCLAKDPRHRPMNAGLVMESLQQIYASMRHKDADLPDLQHPNGAASAFDRPLAVPQPLPRPRAQHTPAPGLPEPGQRAALTGALPQLSHVPLVQPQPGRPPWHFAAAAGLGLVLLLMGLGLGSALSSADAPPPAALPPSPALAAPAAPAEPAEPAAPAVPAEPDEPAPAEMVFEDSAHLQDVLRSPEETAQARREALKEALQRKKDALKRQQDEAAAQAAAPESASPRPVGAGLLPIKRDKSP